MKKKNILAIAMATAMLASAGLTACGSESDKIVISVINFGGGVGKLWLTDAMERFTAEVENKKYGTKTGVEFEEPQNQQSINTANMDTDAYHIYFNQGGSSVRALSQQGFLLPLNDVVTGSLSDFGEDGTIESKIAENYRIMCQGADGNYYGLPHYEFYPGITYDVELFDANNLYFAATGANNVETRFGNARLVESKTETKSLGPNGKTGTIGGIDYSLDDGLPSSLTELLILCDYMKSTLTITPFGLSGANANYINYMLAGLWASLGGYEEMMACYDFSGKVKVVTGVDVETPLFPEIDYVATPTVQEVPVTEATGYYAFQSAARYYALAFADIAVNEGWLTFSSTQGSSNTEEQKYFIFNGKKLANNTIEKTAMLIEGSYWYNESADVNNFEDYYTLTKSTKREIAWMSLPVTFDTPVTSEAQGRAPTLVETAAAYAYVNGNIADDEGLAEACKDFLRFLYTDKELSLFSERTGVMKAVSYNVENTSSLDYYKEHMTKLRAGANIVYMGSNKQTMLDGYGSLGMGTNGFIFKYGSSFNCLSALRASTHTHTVFNEGATRMESSWGTLYKGEQ